MHITIFSLIVNRKLTNCLQPTWIAYFWYKQILLNMCICCYQLLQSNTCPILINPFLKFDIIYTILKSNSPSTKYDNMSVLCILVSTNNRLLILTSHWQWRYKNDVLNQIIPYLNMSVFNAMQSFPNNVVLFSFWLRISLKTISFHWGISFHFLFIWGLSTVTISFSTVNNGGTKSSWFLVFFDLLLSFDMLVLPTSLDYSETLI